MTTCPIHDKVLVCPTCAAIERGRAGGRNGVRPRKAKQKAEPDQSVYRAKDCLRTFQQEPNRDFNAAGLVQAAAPEKHTSAHEKIFRILQYLYAQGKIQRVGEGEYRLAQK